MSAKYRSLKSLDFKLQNRYKHESSKAKEELQKLKY